ncbi:MAG TPA: hypothetical protein VGN90_05355 [Pyrinomonadaceae bacterium]|nr:hypothetical protein [Pyrinomonadaceae bacterium]
MQEIDHTANPFPGLRPFESSETHLFFGRDGQSEELLRRLRRTRFLAVVGTSGSGKSSLVRAGLLPALQGGLMASAGSDWRIAILRPGGDPIGNLARALASPAVLGSPNDKGDNMQAVMAETTLRRSSLGLVEFVSRARTKLDDSGQPLFPDYENLLIVVDQFEELFRFKQLIEEENSKEDAAAFVKLLLEAVGQQNEKKIYVVLTMRSDFLGDCSQFFELPEAINNGQYLIPRMTRDERREAISGPVAVGQGVISEPLISQLLNDVGDNPDQLPIMQHALMRTWDHWLSHRNGRPMDIPDYNAIGGMAEALSRHADEAYAELSDSQKAIAEKLFKGLTEKGADNREIRRPMEVQEICELTGADEAAVIAVVEVFRSEGRSFLMPPPTDALTDTPVHLNRESLIDISHESLIRNWERLKTWVDDESRSARVYRRLAETAVLHKEGGAGLWRDPDLGVALTWRQQSNPNKVWAKRYHPEFPLAMSFLDESVAARDAQLASEEARRKKEINRTRLTALVCVLGFLVSTGMGVFAYGRMGVAEKAQDQARKGEKLALEAVNENRRLLYSSDMGLAQTAFEENNSARAQELLSRYTYDPTKPVLLVGDRKLEATEDLRGFEWDYLWGLVNRKLKTLKLAEDSTAAKADASSASSPDADIPAASVAFWDNVIATSGSDKIVRLWARDSNREPIKLPAHNEPVTSLALSSSYLVAVGGRNAVEIRPFGSPRGGIMDYPYEVKDTIKLKGINDRIALNFSTDGHYLAVGNGGTFILWDEKANEDFTLAEGGDGIASVAFVDQDKSLITCDGQKLTRWAVATRRPTEIKLLVKDEQKPLIKSFTLSLDSKTMVTNGDRSFMVWTAVNKEGTAYKLKSELPAHKESALRRTPYNLVVAIAPDGTRLATGDGTDLKNGGGVKLWDITGEQPKELFTLSPDVADATSLAFLGNAETLAVGARDAVQFWDVSNKKPSTSIDEMATPIYAPDQKSFVTVYDPTTVTVSSYSPSSLYSTIENHMELSSFGFTTANTDVANRGDRDQIIPVALANGGKLLATRQGDVLRIWDVSSDKPKLQATITGGVGSAVAFSPVDKMIATAPSLGIVDWWSIDKDQSRPNQTVVAPGHVRAMAFSPDGKILAVGGGSSEAESGLVTLWDTQTHKPLDLHIRGHQGVGVDVTSLAFSPTDNRILAVGGTDKTIELWDVSTGKLLALPLEGHRFPVTSVAYSPDGRTIASGDSGGIVNVWSASTFQWMLELKDSSSANEIKTIAFSFSTEQPGMLTYDVKGKARLWPAAPHEQVAAQRR